MTCEWRTISLRPVQKEVSDLWKQAISLISVDLGVQGTPRPSPTALAEKFALLVIEHYESQVSNAEHLRQAKAGIMRCWYPAVSDVEFTVPDTGRNLTICGSYAHLESHHLIPRSLGTDNKRAWLCASHHRAISDGVSGRDWKWLRQALGYATE